MPPVTKAADLAAATKIVLGGASLDDTLARRLLELRVETTTGLPDVCVLRFAEDEVASGGGGDLPLNVLDDQRFKLGALVKVELAKAKGGNLAPVFDGEITTIEIDLRPPSDGNEASQEIVITAHDRSHRMHRVATARTMRQVTASDVARKVAGQHGLKVGKINLASANVTMEVAHQVGESDWAFLSRLVREYGGELDVDQGALNIVDPTKKPPSVATLTYGENLMRFHARATTLGQVEQVDVRGWDYKKKEQVEATVKPTAASTAESAAINGAISGTKAIVATARVATQPQAKAYAQALAQRVGHERVQGEAIADGDPLLLAGTGVTVKGVGKRFNGDHRIVSAVHHIGVRGYQTHLTLGAGGRPLAEGLSNGGRPPREFSEQLVVGLVTDNNDPDKLGRVKVSYGAMGKDVESGWVRVVREASGKERGAVALPHISDEVVLGFEHGDIHRPFVLGCLFNGKDTPGTDLLKTSSSLAARFPRDLDVATREKTLLTAGKDVTVKSEQGPIGLTAGKGVAIKASEGGAPSPVTIETTGQIKASGKQGIELAANGPVKITSTAPVTVESNAALQLKGSMIQIQGTGVVQISGATVMLG